MTPITLIDGNSIGHAAQHRKGGKLSAGAVETTAIYGALMSVRKILRETSGRAPVILWDGRSWRYRVYPDYKANRTKTAELVTAREAYKTQRKAIAEAFGYLAIPQAIAGNMEADDLAAILSKLARKRGNSVVLITGDKDWLQLVKHGVIWKDHKMDRMATFRNFSEVAQAPCPRTFVQIKALCGDTGDNVPGCGGIGKKGARDFIETFRSVDAFITMDIGEVAGRWKITKGGNVPAKYLKLRDDPQTLENYKRGLLLMDLNHPDIPKPENLRTIRGTYDEAKFRKLCMRFGFASIINDFERWILPFRSLQEKNT